MAKTDQVEVAFKIKNENGLRLKQLTCWLINNSPFTIPMARSSNRKRKSVEKFHFGREKEVKEQEYFVFPGKGIELRKLPGLYERVSFVFFGDGF